MFEKLQDVFKCDITVLNRHNQTVADVVPADQPEFLNFVLSRRLAAVGQSTLARPPTHAASASSGMVGVVQTENTSANIEKEQPAEACVHVCQSHACVCVCVAECFACVFKCIRMLCDIRVLQGILCVACVCSNV